MLWQHLLELQHQRRQATRVHLLTLNLPADIEALAGHAAQVAAAKEDGSRPAPAPQAVLPTEMRKMRRDHRSPPDLTKTAVVVGAVNRALARTHAAGLPQQLQRHLSPPLQLVATVKLE
jgi:hypothetical protein